MVNISVAGHFDFPDMHAFYLESNNWAYNVTSLIDLL